MAKQKDSKKLKNLENREKSSQKKTNEKKSKPAKISKDKPEKTIKPEKKIKKIEKKEKKINKSDSKPELIILPSDQKLKKEKKKPLIEIPLSPPKEKKAVKILKNLSESYSRDCILSILGSNIDLTYKEISSELQKQYKSLTTTHLNIDLASFEKSGEIILINGKYHKYQVNDKEDSVQEVEEIKKDGKKNNNNEDKEKEKEKKKKVVGKQNKKINKKTEEEIAPHDILLIDDEEKNLKIKEKSNSKKTFEKLGEMMIENDYHDDPFGKILNVENSPQIEKDWEINYLKLESEEKIKDKNKSSAKNKSANKNILIE